MKFKVYVLTFAQLLHDVTVDYVISVLQFFFFFLNHLKKKLFNVYPMFAKWRRIKSFNLEGV